MSTFIPFKSLAEAIHHISEHFSAKKTRMPEVKAHKQIIYGRSSYPLKLSEVKQTCGIVSLSLGIIKTVAKSQKRCNMSVDKESKSFTAYM